MERRRKYKGTTVPLRGFAAVVYVCIITAAYNNTLNNLTKERAKELFWNSGHSVKRYDDI